MPPRSRATAIVLVVVLAPCGIGGLALGLASRGDAGRVLVGSPMALVAAALIYLHRVRRQGRAWLAVRDVRELGQRGVVLPYSAALGCCYLATGGWFVLYVGLLAAIPTGIGVDLGSIGVGEIVGLVIVLMLCAYPLWIVLELVRGRLGRGLVALTPDGIYHRSWAMRSYLPWHGVFAVASEETEAGLRVKVRAFANAEGSWTRRTSVAWKQDELASAPDLDVRGLYLAVDPALLYRAAQFYHENPVARPELATEAGLARVRDGLPA